VRIHAGVAQGGAHAVDEVRLSELAGREVHGQRQPRVERAQRLARHLHHAAAHRHDEARCLGRGEEAVRAEQAALRVLPADQSLEPDRLAVREVHDRLVVQEQLLLGEGAVQRSLGLERGGGRGPQLFVEDLVAVPTPLLGPVRGGVGEAHELRRRRVILRDGDPDAGGHEHLAALQLEGGPERQGDAVGYLLGIDG
jgi:hypothetical protein